MGPEATCNAIVEGTAGLSWSWDARFGGVLATFAKADAGPIELAFGVFESSFGPDTIGAAPEVVQRIVNKYGGLRPGQRFYISGASEPVMVYAAWWPYSSGDPISARVRMAQPGSTPEARELLDATMKKWFVG